MQCCHFLFLGEKESNQRKIKKGMKQPIPFAVPWLSSSATVASAFVFMVFCLLMDKWKQ